MLSIFVLGFLLSTVNTRPIAEDLSVLTDDQKTKEIEDLKQILNDVSYVTNFKNMMADYVKSQYNDLTVHDMEKIHDYLEEFCHRFAKDLKNIIENIDNFSDIEAIEDGLPDSTFEDIRNCIKNELPNIKSETADRITYALRKNIYKTRQKIDEVIRNMEISSVKNA